MIKSLKPHLFIYLILIFICVSCNHKNPTINTSTPGKNTDSTTLTSTSSPQPDYITVKTWLDDFKNFRMAVYHQDSAKLKTYFNFPVKDEGREFWNIINGMQEESAAHRAAHPGDFFTAKDFEANYKKMFPPEFLPGILKIKSEILYKTGKAETKILSGNSKDYRFTAHFDEEDQTLYLAVNYNNGNDENGNYVSEGEYSLMFTFKILDHKKLIFDRIVSAG